MFYWQLFGLKAGQFHSKLVLHLHEVETLYRKTFYENMDLKHSRKP